MVVIDGGREQGFEVVDGDKAHIFDVHMKSGKKGNYLEVLQSQLVDMDLFLR